MPTRRAPARRPLKAAAKTPRPRTKATKFLRFHYSNELHTRTLAVLEQVEQAPDPVQHRDELAEVVVGLTNAGLDSFFTKPLERAGAGFVVEQSAKLGMAGAQQIFGSAIRNVIGRMDAPPLVSVCKSIRLFMV
jgi:hypothetical protein